MYDSVFRETLSYTEKAGSMSMSMSMPAKYFVTASTVPGTRSSSPSSLTTRTPNATVIVLAPTAPSSTNTQAQAQKKVNAMTNNIKSPGDINSDNDNEMDQSKASTFGGGLSGGAIGGIAVAMVAVVAVAAAAVIKKRTSPSS